MSKRNQGFTLVELLVVIVIIGMLVALLVPVVSMAREAAKQAKCTNNQKEIATALISYESTKQRLPGFLNPPDLNLSGKNKPDLRPSWPMVIFEQLGRNDIVTSATENGWDSPQTDRVIDVLVCPDDSTTKQAYEQAKQWAAGLSNDSGRPLSYVVPRELFLDRSNPNSPPANQTISGITNPGQTIMLGERTVLKNTHAGPWGLWKSANANEAEKRLTFIWPGTDKTPPLPPPDISLDISPDVLASAHPGVAIVTFFDGHSEKLPETTKCYSRPENHQDSKLATPLKY